MSVFEQGDQFPGGVNPAYQQIAGYANATAAEILAGVRAQLGQHQELLGVPAVHNPIDVFSRTAVAAMPVPGVLGRWKK